MSHALDEWGRHALVVLFLQTDGDIRGHIGISCHYHESTAAFAIGSIFGVRKSVRKAILIPQVVTNSLIKMKVP